MALTTQYTNKPEYGHLEIQNRVCITASATHVAAGATRRSAGSQPCTRGLFTQHTEPVFSQVKVRPVHNHQ